MDERDAMGLEEGLVERRMAQRDRVKGWDKADRDEIGLREGWDERGQMG